MSASGEKQRAKATKSDWITPDEVIGAAHKLLSVQSFDLDAAATRGTSKGRTYLTGPCRSSGCDTCGLCAPWFGNVWVNPPYGKLKPWVSKAVGEAAHGAHVVMLLPAGVSAEWFETAFTFSRRLFLLRGRIEFLPRGEHGSSISSTLWEFTPEGIAEDRGGPDTFVWNWRTGKVIGRNTV